MMWRLWQIKSAVAHLRRGVNHWDDFFYKQVASLRQVYMVQN